MRSLLSALALVCLTTPALAHFKLNAPLSSTVQATNGDPQKTAPCGGGTATTDVTNYLPGQTITIDVDETIDHPGHYRVALAQSEALLPAPPPVTAGATACGSAPIDAAPVMPILADGLFVNLTAAQGADTAQITLPAGMTCENCVMQVIEFMSDHAAPCFYYHCAKVNISNAIPVDGAPASNEDAGTTGPGNNNPTTTGGCSTGGGAGLLVGFALLGLVIKRRR
jgi:uncharacterized protein (TIGR03382 family)